MNMTVKWGSCQYTWQREELRGSQLVEGIFDPLRESWANMKVKRGDKKFSGVTLKTRF